MKFKVGDRVRYIADLWDVEPGEYGTVCVIEHESVGVAFDQSTSDRHNLDGACENFHGWWVGEEYLDFAEEEVQEADGLTGLADLLG